MTKLQALRFEKGWTQQELAEKAKVTQSTVSRIEAGGEYGFNPRKAKAIADALEVKVSDIDEFVEAFNRGKENRRTELNPAAV